MGFIEKLKSVFGSARGDRRTKHGSRRKPASPGGGGNLPGGGSAKEASETNPQRAAELAD
jgi:hypothetical protein